jgi:hypothetical protein
VPLHVFGIDVESFFQCPNGISIAAPQEQNPPDLVGGHAIARVLAFGLSSMPERGVVIACGSQVESRTP